MKARMTAAKFRNSSITHSRQASGVTARAMERVTKGIRPAKAKPTASPGGRVALNGCIRPRWLSAGGPDTLSLLLPIRQARQARRPGRPTARQRLEQAFQTALHPHQLGSTAAVVHSGIGQSHPGVEEGIQLGLLPGQSMA